MFVIKNMPTLITIPDASEIRIQLQVRRCKASSMSRVRARGTTTDRIYPARQSFRTYKIPQPNKELTFLTVTLWDFPFLEIEYVSPWWNKHLPTGKKVQTHTKERFWKEELVSQLNEQPFCWLTKHLSVVKINRPAKYDSCEFWTKGQYFRNVEYDLKGVQASEIQ